MAEAVILIPRAWPSAIYPERSNGFISVEFTTNDLQGFSVECPGDVFAQLNLARADLEYDIEIVIRER